MTNWNGNGGGWGGDAPVFDTNFEYDWGGRRWPYPDVWITYQRDMPTATRTGRDCIWHYTPDQDDDGWEALGYGGDYYDEGMSCVDDDEHEKRVMCFQAAELLYLHAAAKGNPIGDLFLGYVYAYDRCEDKYWEKLTGWQTDEDLRTPFDCDGHAYRHFRRAAGAAVKTMLVAAECQLKKQMTQLRLQTQFLLILFQLCQMFLLQFIFVNCHPVLLRAAVRKLPDSH